MALAAALAFLAPSAAAAFGDGDAGLPRSRSGVARVVEIRVSGDAAALARVRMTARELLLRLDVQPNVKSMDEPETSADEPTPLVIAYVDLRSVSSPSIDIQDGKTRQELTRRSLSDVATLETGVESVLHVLYLAVESALQVGVAIPPPPAKRPAPPRTKPQSSVSRSRSGSGSGSGLDFGPLLRLSSLGGTRIVPGGGVLLEPRTDLGRGQLGLMLAGAVHGTSELSFEHGAVEVRPLQARLVPTFDWLFSSDVSGCFGFGAGLDAFVVEPVQPPDSGRVRVGETAIDPVLTGMIGARVPIAGRAFLSALASLDLDLVPTSFVARVGDTNESILHLPRFRGGFTLALSFSALGSRRFLPAAEVAQ
jgi:hypothetical protein